MKKTGGGKPGKGEKQDEAETPRSSALDGGVYLLVADESEEFQMALKKASAMANQNRGHVAILYVMEEQDFLHWGMVEKRISSDLRAGAEKRVWEIASRLYEMSGQRPAIYIREGKTREAILSVLDSDPLIKMLVLGAGTQSSNPLVSFFTGKGLASLRVPLLVVPDNI